MIQIIRVMKYMEKTHKKNVQVQELFDRGNFLKSS